MRRRYVVGANPVTAEEETALREWLRANGYGWWNWIDGFWMVHDNLGRLSLEALRDAFRDLAPDARVIVLQIPEGDSWAGFGPAGPEKNMFKWLKSTWK